MAANRAVIRLTVLLLISTARCLSAVRLRGLEHPIESGSDVIVTCEGSNADVEDLSSISIYGKLSGEAEMRLIHVVATVAGIKENWNSDVQATFRQRASFGASMTQQRALIQLKIQNLTCSDSGMMLRCKVVGVGVSATSLQTRLRVRARFSRLHIDGGELACDSLTSPSLRTRVGCNGCERAATRGKETTFSCWGDVDANLRDNFSISWYKVSWNDVTGRWIKQPLLDTSDIDTSGTLNSHRQTDPDCQLATLNSTLKYYVHPDENDIEITCEITGPTMQGVNIITNNTIKTCAVDPENMPMNVVVIPKSITADIGNSTVFMCKADGDPPVTYEWLKIVGSNKVAAGPPKSEHGLLQIADVTKKEIGTYICLARDLHRSLEATVQLRYPEPPEIIVPDEYVVTPGVVKKLTCDVRATGRVDILMWPLKSADRNGSTSLSPWSLSRTDDVLLRGPVASATLHIRTKTDIRASGNYSCQATIHGITYSKTTYIRVEGGAEITDYFPKSRTLQFLGTTSSLTCSVRGIPEPAVTWFFEDTPVTTGKDTVIINSRTMDGTFGLVSELQIVNLTQAMIGNYTCQAENRYNVTHVTFTILRKGPPAVPTLTVQNNEEGQFSLIVRSNPDDGGDAAATYSVAYQLFPQGKMHRMLVTTQPEKSKAARQSGGFFEIHMGVGWRRLCYTLLNNGKVACRMLGYRSVLAARGQRSYDSGIYRQCLGTETSVTQCPDLGPRSCRVKLQVYCQGKIFNRVNVITVKKIARGRAHYVAVSGNNVHGTGEQAALLIDM